jgi:glycylpeptide N-tetradecanoyltransferase
LGSGEVIANCHAFTFSSTHVAAELLASPATTATMQPTQPSSVDEIIETVEDLHEEDNEHESDSDEDENESNQASASTSEFPEAESSKKSKKKKKKGKLSKAMSALKNAVKADDIPQDLVDMVVSKVREEHGEGAPGTDEASVRQALAQMGIKDVVKGKAGISGRGKKDLGEHKVSVTYLRATECLRLWR